MNNVSPPAVLLAALLTLPLAARADHFRGAKAGTSEHDAKQAKSTEFKCT